MSGPLALIVEDEVLVRHTAVFLLKKPASLRSKPAEAGFATLQAGSADEAIVLLEPRNDIQVATGSRHSSSLAAGAASSNIRATANPQ